MPPKTRAPHWQPSDERDAADHLAVAMSAHMASIAQDGPHIYDSEDMKVGVNLPKLVRNEDLMCSLIRVDPRGGHFANQDVADGLLKVLRHPSNQKLRDLIMTPEALTAYTTLEGIVAMVAYKIRVMLAHRRRRFEAGAHFTNMMQQATEKKRIPKNPLLP